jgi:hypothetical protein
VELCWQSDWPVHQLWPPTRRKQRTTLDVVFFHGLQLTANYTGDAWWSTWTQRGKDDVCWPREWLPFDFGDGVRIISVSYNAHITSPHDHASEIAHNLFMSLMNRRYESPLFDYERTVFGPVKWFQLQMCEVTNFFIHRICSPIVGSSLVCIEKL